MNEILAQTLLAKAYKSVKKRHSNSTRDAASFARNAAALIRPKNSDVAKTIEDCFPTYISSHFKKGKWAKLMKSSQITDELAKLCEFNDATRKPKKFIDFTHFCNGDHSDITPDEIKLIFKSLNIEYKSLIPSYFITDKHFQILEFETPGIEINCITFSLHWAIKLLPQQLEKIRKSGNRYRYLLTESRHDINVKIIEDILQDDPELTEQVQIRKLSELGESIFDLSGMPFPISNDIVIYRQKKENGRYEVRSGIIGIPPYVDNPTEGYSIKIEDQRAQEIYHWFNNIWNRITENRAMVKT